MGVDAILLVKLREDLEHYDYEKSDEGAHFGIDAPYISCRELGRYWSPSYTRGNWLSILTEILYVMQDDNVKDVWYGGDDGRGYEKMTPRALRRLTKEWMNQNLPRSR